MDQMALVQLWVDTCPDCGIRITLEGELPMGRLLVCPSCGTNLGFVETTLSEPDWLFDWESEEYGEFQIEDLDQDRDLRPLPMPN
jgi:hypothetical protein